MKVFHIESGLGNQMLSYCELLAAQLVDPDDEYYIETIIYDIPECNSVINQWNGYELKRIFGIQAPNIKSYFDKNSWEQIMREIHDTKFWSRNWNYPVYFTKAFNNVGLNLKNIRGDFEDTAFVAKSSSQKTVKATFIDTKLGNTVKRLLYEIMKRKKLKEADNRRNIFTNERDVFTGQWLSFKNRGNDIELIEDKIRQTFTFPEFTNQRDKIFSQILINENSVAIHARRGDMLSYNNSCYKYGYFQRAVKYIRKKIEKPYFVFFCDPGSVEWCKDNADVFGLNFAKDKVDFVDWHNGQESYRDMQLMALCKHAIITNSSFGWWGAFLIKNKDKITISPSVVINTTYHC